MIRSAHLTLDSHFKHIRLIISSLVVRRYLSQTRWPAGRGATDGVQTVQYLRSQRPTSIRPGSVPTLSNSELSVSTASDPPVSQDK